VLLAACDEPAGPDPIPAGTFSATLTGAVAGEYAAHGAPQLPAAPAPATYASALAGRPGTAAYLVVGARAAGADRQDAVQLDLRGVTGPGDYPAAGDLTLGVATAAAPAPPERVYRFVAGTVRVTALPRGRIAGEFAGVAVGGALDSTTFQLPADTVRLAAGRFDVPIVRP
jgi:hypothetical protein